MAIDPTYTQSTAIRLAKIETALSDVWRLLRYVINKEQFNRLNVLNQKNLERLSARISELETRLSELESKYDDLL